MIKKMINKMFKKYDINEYVLIEYTSNGGAGCMTLAREVLNGIYKSVYNGSTIDENEITFYKPLTDYIDNNNGRVTDYQASQLADRSVFDKFFEDWIAFYCKKDKKKEEKELKFLPICVQ